jgi:hypothetical protein
MCGCTGCCPEGEDDSVTEQSADATLGFPRRYFSVARRVFGFLLAATALCPCALAQGWPKEMTFHSGRKVRILDVQQIERKHETGEVVTALLLHYETRLSLTDRAAVQREVDEIWAWFRIDVEHRNLAEALIWVEPRADSAKNPDHLDFSFERRRDGVWAQVGGTR